MQRIMIIGPCGAGKSTISKKLQEITGLDLFHLDQYYFKPDWVETPKEEWEKIVRRLSDQPSWIIDGNYGGTMDMRLKRADAVIFLDYPTWTCLSRVTKRVFKHYNKKRPDMAEGCRERWDWDFMHYVLTFRMVKRKGILKRLEKVAPTTQIFILKNDKQVKHFLVSLETRYK